VFVLFLCISTIILPLSFSLLNYFLLCAGSQAFRNAEFGEGTGPIFLEGLDCDGTETSLLDCTMDVELGLTLCDHSDDAGIKCFGEQDYRHFILPLETVNMRFLKLLGSKYCMCTLIISYC